MTSTIIIVRIGRSRSDDNIATISLNCKRAGLRIRGVITCNVLVIIVNHIKVCHIRSDLIVSYIGAGHRIGDSRQGVARKQTVVGVIRKCIGLTRVQSRIAFACDSERSLVDRQGAFVVGHRVIGILVIRFFFLVSNVVDNG